MDKGTPFFLFVPDLYPLTILCISVCQSIPVVSVYSRPISTQCPVYLSIPDPYQHTAPCTSMYLICTYSPSPVSLYTRPVPTPRPVYVCTRLVTLNPTVLRSVYPALLPSLFSIIDSSASFSIHPNISNIHSPLAISVPSSVFPLSLQVCLPHPTDTFFIRLSLKLISFSNLFYLSS